MIVVLITYFYWNIILKGNIIRKMAFSCYEMDRKIRIWKYYIGTVKHS
jgi:hypothetical protein